MKGDFFVYMVEQSQRGYIRPISITPNPEGEGCIVCGEFHPIQDQPTCSIHRVTKQITLPMSAEKILDHNQVSIDHGAPTTIVEQDTKVVIFDANNITPGIFNEDADFYIQATENRLLDVEIPSVNSLGQLNKNLSIAKLEDGMPEGRPVRVKPYSKTTREILDANPLTEVF